MTKALSNYGMELDMEVESTIAKLHSSSEGFTFESPGLLRDTRRCFTGGFYIDSDGRRIELMSRWHLSQKLSKVVLSSITRQSRPHPTPMYESVSLTIDDPNRRIGRICLWDFMNSSKHSLTDGNMLIHDINEEDYDYSTIHGTPIPFHRHDDLKDLPWMPGSTALSEYQPDYAHACEQGLIKVLRDGSAIGWQALWN